MKRICFCKLTNITFRSSPLPTFPILDNERSYLTLKKRYSKLNISDDFVLSISTWQNTFPPENKYPLNFTFPIYCEYDDSLPKIEKVTILGDRVFFHKLIFFF